MGTAEGDSRLLGPASGRPSARVLWAEGCRALTHCPVAAWQGVERDLRSQLSGGERGLVEEYVEKVPNPSLKSESGDLGSHTAVLPKAPRLVPWRPGGVLSRAPTGLFPDSLQAH